MPSRAKAPMWGPRPVGARPMRIHHLNCGTWCPAAARWINGRGGLFAPGEVVCHCLLIETDEGLVLVDTGLGVADLEQPRRRIGPTWSTLMRPRQEPGESALHQIEERGFYADDVRHIVVTHLDFDHAGGIPDFPEATVHVYAPEHAAAMARASFRERFRYKPEQVAAVHAWRRYDLGGDRWFGFESVRALGDREGEVLLIPLPGHTRGHCGVAVRSGEGWLLLAGDQYFHHGELEAGGRSPLGLQLYQGAMHLDRSRRMANQRRLQQLQREHGREVRIFSSHDPDEFYPFVAAAAPAERPAHR